MKGNNERNSNNFIRVVCLPNGLFSLFISVQKTQEEMKALVTGVTGQDGSYLAEYLLEKGYEVCGMYRRTSTDNSARISHLLDDSRFTLMYGDLQDISSLISLIANFKPTEVYNLASQSDVGVSFKLPLQTADITGVGVLRMLEAIRQVDKNIKFYQASSSEMFGKVAETPQTELTPMNIRSPYGASKLFGYWITRNYRDGYDMFACNGILFNHESPRRGDNFVTQKIVKHLIQVWKREREYIELGNLDSKRDWGYAGDYVKAMWAMLQAPQPDDYVIATGETHSVREFVEETAKQLDWDITWKGQGLDEVGINQHGQTVVKVNPQYYRPAEVDLLIGDYTKAYKDLGWQPTTKFKELVQLMVEAQLNG